MKKLIKVLDSKVGMVIAIGAIGAVALYVADKKISAGASAVGSAIDPTNNDNIFASGVNNVGAILTGDERFSLGGWIYDKVNGTSSNIDLDIYRGLPSNE